jgi:hypothetical protein
MPEPSGVSQDVPVVAGSRETTGTMSPRCRVTVAPAPSRCRPAASTTGPSTGRSSTAPRTVRLSVTCSRTVVAWTTGTATVPCAVG